MYIDTRSADVVPTDEAIGYLEGVLGGGAAAAE